MPMTMTQASTQNLINSVRDWIIPNIVTPYTAEVSGKPYQGKPTVSLMDPDDVAVKAGAATITIELPIDVKGPEGVGVGDGIIWRYKQIHMVVLPAMNQDGIDAGKPSIQSTATLQKYFDYALGTALVIPINDYSTGTVVPKIDYAYVEQQRIVRPTGKFIEALAINRHRFDYSLVLKYAAITIN